MKNKLAEKQTGHFLAVVNFLFYCFDFYIVIFKNPNLPLHRHFWLKKKKMLTPSDILHIWMTWNVHFKSNHYTIKAKLNWTAATREFLTVCQKTIVYVFVLACRDLLIHCSSRKCSAMLAVVILLGSCVSLRIFHSALQASVTNRQQIYMLSNGETHRNGGLSHHNWALKAGDESWLHRD